MGPSISPSSLLELKDEKMQIMFRRRGIHLMFIDSPETLTFRLLQHATGLYHLTSRKEILDIVQEKEGYTKVMSLELDFVHIRKKAQKGHDLASIINELISSLQLHLGVRLEIVVEKYNEEEPEMKIKEQHGNSQLRCAGIYLLDALSEKSFRCVTCCSLRSIYESQMDYENAMVALLIQEQELYKLSRSLLINAGNIRERCEAILLKIDAPEVDSVKSLYESLELNFGPEPGSLPILKLIVRDKTLNLKNNSFFLYVKDQFVFALEDASVRLVEEGIAKHFQDLQQIREQRVSLLKESEEMESVVQRTNELSSKIARQRWRIVLKRVCQEEHKREIQINKFKLLVVQAQLQERKRDIAFIKFTEKLQAFVPSYEFLKQSSKHSEEIESIDTFQKMFTFFEKNCWELGNAVEVLSLLSESPKARVYISQWKKLILSVIISEHHVTYRKERRMKETMSICGRHVLTSQLSTEIEKFCSLEIGEGIKEIRILGGHTIYIDSDLKIPGCNLVIKAPVIKVRVLQPSGTNVTIDTSGKSAAGVHIHTLLKAEDGSAPGRSGKDGRDGDDGGHAGHILIQSDRQFCNPEFLCVRASGGRGDNGQNGGDGKDGMEGTDGNDGQANESDTEYYTFDAMTPGTCGGTGGNGGDGGAAGLGGKSGNVRVSCSIQGDLLDKLAAVQASDGIPGKNGSPGKGGCGGSGGWQGLDHHMGYRGTGTGTLRWFGGEWISKKGRYRPRYWRNFLGQGQIVSVTLDPVDSDPSRRICNATGEAGEDGVVNINHVKAEIHMSNSILRDIDINGLEREYNSILQAYALPAIDMSTEEIQSDLQCLQEKELLTQHSKDCAEICRKEVEAEADKAEAEISEIMGQNSSLLSQRKLEAEALAKTRRKEELLKQTEGKLLSNEDVAKQRALIAELDRMFRKRREQKIMREQEVMRIIPFEEETINNRDTSNIGTEQVQDITVTEEDEEKDFTVDPVVVDLLGSSDPHLLESFQLGIEDIKRQTSDRKILDLFSRTFMNEGRINKNELLLNEDYLRFGIASDMSVALQCVEETVINACLDAFGVKKLEERRTEEFFGSSGTDGESRETEKNKRCSDVWRVLEKARLHKFESAELRNIYFRVSKTEATSNEGKILVRHLQNILVHRIRSVFIQKLLTILSSNEETELKLTEQRDFGAQIFHKLQKLVKELQSLGIEGVDIFNAVEMFNAEATKFQNLGEEEFWNYLVCRIAGAEYDADLVKTVKSVEHCKSKLKEECQISSSSASEKKLRLTVFFLENLVFPCVENLDALQFYLDSFFKSVAIQSKACTKLIERGKKAIHNQYLEKWQNPTCNGIINDLVPFTTFGDKYGELVAVVNDIIVLQESSYSVKSYKSRIETYTALRVILEKSRANNTASSLDDICKDVVKMHSEMLKLSAEDDEFLKNPATSNLSNAYALRKASSLVRLKNVSLDQIWKISSGILELAQKHGNAKITQEIQKKLSDLLMLLYQKMVQRQLEDFGKGNEGAGATLEENQKFVFDLCSEILENSSQVINTEMALDHIRVGVSAVLTAASIRSSSFKSNPAPSVIAEELKKDVLKQSKSYFTMNPSTNLTSSISKFLVEKSKDMSKIFESSSSEKICGREEIAKFLKASANLDKCFSDEEIEVVRKTCFGEILQLALSIPDSFNLNDVKCKAVETVESDAVKYFGSEESAEIQETLKILRSRGPTYGMEVGINEEILTTLELWYCTHVFKDAKNASSLFDALEQFSLLCRKKDEEIQSSGFELISSALKNIAVFYQYLSDSGISVCYVDHSDFTVKAVDTLKIHDQTKSEIIDKLRTLVSLEWCKIIHAQLKIFWKSVDNSAVNVKKVAVLLLKEIGKGASPENDVSLLQSLFFLLDVYLPKRDTSWDLVQKLYETAAEVKPTSHQGTAEILHICQTQLLQKLHQLLLTSIKQQFGRKSHIIVSKFFESLETTLPSIFLDSSNKTAKPDIAKMLKFKFDIVQQLCREVKLNPQKFANEQVLSCLEKQTLQLLIQSFQSSGKVLEKSTWVDLVETTMFHTYTLSSKDEESKPHLYISLGMLQLRSSFLIETDSFLLNSLETDFLNRIHEGGNAVMLQISEQQKNSFVAFCKSIFSGKEKIGHNRILEILLEGWDKSSFNEEEGLGLFTKAEMFYLQEALEHVEVERVKKILLSSPPCAWKLAFRQIIVDEIFKSIVESSKVGVDERIISSLKHNFNRSLFFHSMSKTDKTSFSKEQVWFESMTYMAKQLRPFPISAESLTKCLQYSAEVELTSFRNILLKRLPGNWLIALNAQTINQLFRKITKSKQNLVHFNEEKENQLMASLNNTLDKFKGKDGSAVLEVMKEKLSTEIQLGGLGSKTDLANLVSLLERIAGLVSSISKEELKKLLEGLRSHPLSQWDTIIQGFELHKKGWGTEICKAIVQAAKTHELSLIVKFVELSYSLPVEHLKNDNLLNILGSIADGQLKLDEEVFQEVKKLNNLSEIKAALATYTKKCNKKLRTIDEIFCLMRDDPRNEGILELLNLEEGQEGDSIKRLVNKKITTSLYGPSVLFPKISTSPISGWGKEEITAWAKAFRHEKSLKERWKIVEERTDGFPELLAVISQALYVTQEKLPWNIQFLAVLLLLDSLKGRKHGRLAEISTGEGKTYISAMLAAIHSLCGTDVDIITSSPILAVENSTQMEGFFSVLGINASNNCDSVCERDEKVRKNRYHDNHILYGDVSSFQRDLLLTRFFNKSMTGNRVPSAVIIDEVDSMLLDKGENILYLSHRIPDFKNLRPVLIDIWQATHACDVSKGTKKDMASVARYINRRLEEGALYVPKHLEAFVQRRLPVWIKNAYLAECLRENDPYILAEIEASANRSRHGGKQIVIIDKATGVEQTQMHWSNGLHQFLQMKHMDTLTNESLKAVFISNLSYFKEFDGQIYGITGTLGSKVELDLLSQSYNVDFFSLPRKVARKCVQHRAIIEGDEEQWLKAIEKTVTGMTATNIDKPRSVLVVAENVESATRIANHLKLNGSKVYLYTSSFDDSFLKQFGRQEMGIGQVIVATNLAGRGTDLKANKVLEQNGGLHVILLYLPSNLRIQEQAFGRTARAGQRGSCQFILLEEKGKHSSIQSTSNFINKLITERDERESTRLEKFRTQSLLRIQVEEKLCQKFSKLFQHVKKTLEDKDFSSWYNIRPKKYDKKYVDLQLEFLKNRWALWLDSLRDRVQLTHLSGEESILSGFSSFEAEIKKILEDASQRKNSVMFAKGPSELVQLGRFFEASEMRQSACSCYNSVIKDDPKLAEAAHYYKAAALLKEQPSDGRGEARLELKITRAALEEKVTDLEVSNQIVRVVDEWRRSAGHSSHANRFEAQVKGEVKILSTFIQTINEAVGQPLLQEIVHNCPGVRDSEEAEELYKVLRDMKNIFKPSRVSKKLHFNDDKPREIHITNPVTGSKERISLEKKLNYCHEDIISLLKGKSTSPNREVSMDDFKSLVLTKSELWQLLQDAGYITSSLETKQQLVDFSEENFSRITWPDELKGYESAIQRVLEANNGKSFPSEDLKTDQSGGLKSEEINMVIELLEKVGLVRNEINVTGSINSSGLKYNEAADKVENVITGLPEELKKYSELIIPIVLQENDSDSQTEGRVSFRQTATQSNIRLEDDKYIAASQVYGYLMSLRVIKGPSIRFPMKKSQQEINHETEQVLKTLRNNKELEKLYIKYHEDGEFENFLVNLNKTLLETTGNIKLYEEISTDYNDLDQYFMRSDMPPEVEEYEESLFAQVLSLSRKESVKWNWGAFFVALIGVAQIIAGALLIYYSGGTLTQYGIALIMEGAGDIYFAVESGLKGNFSWQSYAIHKGISLTFTLACFGIGALIAMVTAGAAAAQGTARGFELLQLIGLTVGKQVIRQTALAAASVGVEYSLDKLREQLMQSFRSKLTNLVKLNTTKELNNMKERMNDLYESSYEKGQADRMIQEAISNVLQRRHESDLGQKIGNTCQRLLSRTITEAKNKLPSTGYTGVAKQIFKNMSRVMLVAKVAMHLTELANLSPQIVAEVNKELDRMTVELRNRVKSKSSGQLDLSWKTEKHRADFEVYMNKKRDSLNYQIVNEIMAELQHQYAQPALQALASGLFTQIERLVEQGTKKLLKQIKQSHHNQKQNTNANVDKLADFKEDNKPELTDGAKEKLTIADLDPNANVKGKDGQDMAVSKLQAVFGTNVSVYEKEGMYYYDRPSYEEYVEGMRNLGKNSGTFQLEIIAQKDNVTYEIVNEKGEVITTLNSGCEKVKQIQYSTNADGTGHFAPVFNGKAYHIPQSSSSGTENQCLYQSVTFLRALDEKDGSTFEAQKAASDPEVILREQDSAANFASGNEFFRKCYEQGDFLLMQACRGGFQQTTQFGISEYFKTKHTVQDDDTVKAILTAKNIEEKMINFMKEEFYAVPGNPADGGTKCWRLRFSKPHLGGQITFVIATPGEIMNSINSPGGCLYLNSGLNGMSLYVTTKEFPMITAEVKSWRYNPTDINPKNIDAEVKFVQDGNKNIIFHTTFEFGVKNEEISHFHRVKY